jgi:uncharacterized protein YodC (DUF2158 family)
MLAEDGIANTYGSLLCRWYNSISNSYRCTVKLQSSIFEINLKVGASNIGGKEYGQVSWSYWSTIFCVLDNQPVIIHKY